MKLIYVNKVGNLWKGEYYYEFLFSDADNLKEVIDGEGWDSLPSAGNPEAPVDITKEVGALYTDINFDLIQESESLCMWDAVDGVIAMAIENLEGYDEYPESRLFFHFGEDQKSVEDKLYEKDLVLKYNKETINI
jgi:hypothetical protein